jgi:hypothetical protein
MLAQVLQIFSGKEHLVINQLISTLDKVIYFKGTIFQRSTKPLYTSQNRVEISGKNSPFFQTSFFRRSPKISMALASQICASYNKEIVEKFSSSKNCYCSSNFFNFHILEPFIALKSRAP